MPDLSFSQSERRSYALPIVIVLVLAAIVFGLVYRFTPHRPAELAVTKVSVLPTHTVFPGHSIKVGAQDQAEDDFYVVARVRMHNNLKLPIFINGLTGALMAADGAQVTATAAHPQDLDSLYASFPKLRALVGPLLPREAEIPPGGTAEGDVIVDFPVSQAIWSARSRAEITVDTYHQGALTVAIPK